MTTLQSSIRLAGRNPIATGHKERIDLNPNEIYHLDIHQEPLEVVGLSGKAWITMESVPEDYLLGPGEKISIRRHGRLVAEGLPEASFLVQK